MYTSADLFFNLFYSETDTLVSNNKDAKVGDYTPIKDREVGWKQHKNYNSFSPV